MEKVIRMVEARVNQRLRQLETRLMHAEERIRRLEEAAKPEPARRSPKKQVTKFDTSE